MNRVIEQSARRDPKLHRAQFRPASLSEFFAFRLAQKLDDAPAATHYAELCGRYGEDALLGIFYRVAHVPIAERARQFHRELGSVEPDSASFPLPHTPFAAIRVERRSVSVVVMRGLYVEHIQIRHLSSSAERALSSALGFVNRVVEQFGFQSAGIEPVPQTLDIQRAQITAGIIRTLRDQSVAFWEVSKQELFASFAHPALRSRREIREVVGQICPFFHRTEDSPFIRDAAALGLYCQMERRFIT